MWLLVGFAVLLSGVALANLTDENAFYLAETNEEQSMDVIEKSRYERSELGGAADGTRRSENMEEQPTDNNDPSDDSGLQKSNDKRSIVKMNLRDRSSTHLQAPPSLATLLYWPSREEEVLSMEQRRNPVIEERRNPSFSPWGGKRNAQSYRTIKIRRPVRVPFNSWGGKRSGERVQHTIADLKRGKYVKWGGKKAPPFNSWGGKRSSGIDFDLVPMNRHEEQRQILRKREQLDGGEAQNDFDSNSSEESYSEKMMSNETWKKRGSLKPLTGGAMTTSGSTLDNTFARVAFEPWGGKKRGEIRFHDDEPSAGVSMLFRKIGRFIPWTA